MHGPALLSTNAVNVYVGFRISRNGRALLSFSTSRIQIAHIMAYKVTLAIFPMSEKVPHFERGVKYCGKKLVSGRKSSVIHEFYRVSLIDFVREFKIF